MEIKLYHIDTLEYRGTIAVKGSEWEFLDVDNDHMKNVTRGMPLKALLASLVTFDLVYDIIES
ncbi:MAG: hypothetical protein JW838_07425 [Spirochaetes bacterium]|nr:hypothetical protein [Spirochaetota bacterium]